MKVRHKQGLIAQHIECYDWGADTPFYFPKDSLNWGQTLPRALYEPVPEETWRDVTWDMSVLGGTHLCRDGQFFYRSVPEGYRLRMVTLYEPGTLTSLAKQVWAFIVEQKEA